MLLTISSVKATTSRYFCIIVIDNNITKIAYNEQISLHLLLLLVSKTQSNLWNQNNLTRPVINTLENFSFIFSRN